jgi:hypothetical protein
MSRNEWVLMLANATNPDWPERAAEALAAMMPFLAEFSDDVFRADTIAEIARRMPRPGTPPLGVLLAVLDARRQIGQTIQLALPNPEFAEFTEADHLALAKFLEWKNDGWRDGSAMVNGMDFGERRERCLRVMGRASPMALEYVDRKGLAPAPGFL